VASKIAFFAFVAPLLLIWIVVQLPFSLVGSAAKRRRDRRFAAAMRAAGRVVSWADARVQADGRHGTFVEEWVSTDGYRLWWTPEDVPATCPYPCRFEENESERIDPPVRGGQFKELNELQTADASHYAMFDEWCRSRLTSPQSGTALLVNINEREWMDYMISRAAGGRYISVRTN
jgi:hypothetical protein